jgi:hypothetical protein
MTVVLFLIVVGTTVWVGVDASQRDFSNARGARTTLGWVVGMLLLWFVFLPLYLVERNRASPKKGRTVARPAGPLLPAADGPDPSWIPPTPTPPAPSSSIGPPPPKP